MAVSMRLWKYYYGGGFQAPAVLLQFGLIAIALLGRLLLRQGVWASLRAGQLIGALPIFRRWSARPGLPFCCAMFAGKQSRLPGLLW